jgi:ribonuclease P protein component
MISGEHRFKGNASLRFVYSRGQTVRRGPLSLRYIANERINTYRCAVVVSRKVNKSAVVRNRIRRRLYEVIRLAEPRIKLPYDLVLTVFSEEVADLPHERLVALVEGALKQAHVI